jgi:chromosomal replication initiator protein
VHVNAKQIWQTAIERLQTKVEPAAFTTWFQGTTAISFKDGVFTVGVPSSFAQAHLESRYINLIRSILSDIINQPIEMQFVVAKEVVETPPASSDTGTANHTHSALFPGLSGTSGRRGLRLGRNRPSTEQREQRIAHPAAGSTMQSTTPFLPTSGTRHGSLPDSTTDEPASVLKMTEAQEQPQETHSTAAQQEDTSLLTPSMLPATGTTQPPAKESAWSFTSPITPATEGLLNPRYTFKSFIAGKSNQLAHVAALAVAENPGRVYNPLFFYGGVGLGKTHLLHAIGHVGEESGLNVLYVTSEKFTNEIINAIRFQKTEEFRAKYRQIDILLVDDIQFIAGKESTEEEFFHTFNALHNANKQIVVTSDRPPKAIHSLQDRLRSRFEWGLLADIQPPEYEHRLAILRSKADSLHFPIPNAVIEYIARPECSSVRELEGALNRVIAYATLHGAPLTPQLAAQALEHIYSDAKPTHSALTVQQILEGVCRYYNVDIAQVRGKQRDREIVWPRQVAMYLMREETSASLLQIGSELGGRDHTTIMHGWEKVHAEVTNNERIRREIAAVLETIQRGT